MKLPLVLCAGVLVLSHAARPQTPSSPGQVAKPPECASQVTLATLKRLVGTWTGAVTTDPPNPEIQGPIRVTMHVASGGSVLVHEIAPGGVPEPTMIYLDGDRLTLVHYCEAGNRPRLVARKSPDEKRVEFDFVDLSGNAEPTYLSQFVFTVITADHHTEDWNVHHAR